MELDRAPSGGLGAGGLRRSLSRSASFRRNLSNLSEALGEQER